MKGDHSRPQSELVGAPWAGTGAPLLCRGPTPLLALTQTPWGTRRRGAWPGAHGGRGPAVPTPYPWRPQCHLPSQHSPPPTPLRRTRLLQATRGGCRQQGTARLAVAHPPGVPLLQGRALGFRRVLDHSSGLPREVHRHQRVLRDAALQGQSHQRWDRATRRGTPAISARGTWPSCARRDTERAPRDP